MTAAEWVSSESKAIASSWRVRPELAYRLAVLKLVWYALTRDELEVISGWRSRSEQIALERAGRPAANPDVSTHTESPLAGGADVRIRGNLATLEDKKLLGEITQYVGLRWGGGSPLDRNGVPVDWNHVDLGPRALRV